MKIFVYKIDRINPKEKIEKVLQKALFVFEEFILICESKEHIF